MDFKKQIDEDILDYQERYPYIPNVSKPEWAFNFWILDKLFNVEQDIIESQIIDYNDYGIDCFVWHEDSLDLYLIQNKYYSEGTSLSSDYVKNDYLVRAIGALENGTYTHSPILQDIFNKYKSEPGFNVHFHLYITNESSRKSSITDAISNYNSSHMEKGYDARAFWLNDIKELYYGEPLTNKKSMTFEIESTNSGTILNVNPRDYNLKQSIPARYVFTPILNLYSLCTKANRDGYQLFDSNIREYLGATGPVNKGMVKTLLDTSDAYNFFYYNNGITMIVKDMGGIETKTRLKQQYAAIKIVDPQIVNGCQTVSTIYETLSKFPESEMMERFKDVYVMLKILKISDNNESSRLLSESIVRYNNSQNSIGKRTFDAQASEYFRLQSEFQKKGFLICVKQSDKHKFTEQYKNVSSLLKNSESDLDKYSIIKRSKAKDFMLDLTELMQIFASFNSSVDAVQRKSKMLDPESAVNIRIMSMIKDSGATMADLASLLLLYLRVKQEQSGGAEINPFMLLNCFGRYQCHDKPDEASKILSCKENVDEITRYFKTVLSFYKTFWIQANPGKGYNDMIKSPIDFKMVENCIDATNSVQPIRLKE